MSWDDVLCLLFFSLLLVSMIFVVLNVLRFSVSFLGMRPQTLSLPTRPWASSLNPVSGIVLIVLCGCHAMPCHAC